MKKNIVFLAVLLCLGAAACTLFGVKPSGTEPTPTPEIFQPLPDEQRAFEAVRSALAQQLGVDPLSITLVDVQPVDWPDSCLDLAGPDEMCAQVITPGFLIHVKAGNTTYEFHTDQGGDNVRQKK